jgi:hypothetical protein
MSGAAPRRAIVSDAFALTVFRAEMLRALSGAQECAGDVPVVALVTARHDRTRRRR